MLSPHPIFGDDDNPIVYFKRNPAQNQDNHWTPCQPHEAVACTTPAYDGEVSDLPRKVQDGILVGHIAYCLPGMDVFFTCCPYEPTAIVFFPEVKGGV